MLKAVLHDFTVLKLIYFEQVKLQGFNLSLKPSLSELVQKVTDNKGEIVSKTKFSSSYLLNQFKDH